MLALVAEAIVILSSQLAPFIPAVNVASVLPLTRVPYCVIYVFVPLCPTIIVLLWKSLPCVIAIKYSLALKEAIANVSKTVSVVVPSVALLLVI